MKYQPPLVYLIMSVSTEVSMDIIDSVRKEVLG